MLRRFVSQRENPDGRSRCDRVLGRLPAHVFRRVLATLLLALGFYMVVTDGVVTGGR